MFASGIIDQFQGGKEVESKLKVLLNQINNEEDSRNAYDIHRRYEEIHPLTDCNGRTGRAIWAWLMLKDHYSFRLGFLHQWYYQSLDNGRR